MIGLVDGDLLVYKCGFAAEKRRKQLNEDGSIEHIKEVEPLNFALQNIDTVIDFLLTKFSSLEIFLTGKGNFRDNIATLKPYKGQRSPFAKPVHYKEIREFLIKKHKAVVVNGMEADDALGLRQSANIKAQEEWDARSRTD